MLSSLTYAVGATANGLGGVAGDWLVKRYGLRNGRRWLGVAGLSVPQPGPDWDHLRA